MKILIIVPRFTISLNRSYPFPIGLSYICASLKNANFSVEVLNLNHVQGSVNDLITQEISQKEITTVMTGGLSQHYHLIKEIIETVKNYDSKIITIGGGGGYTSEPVLFTRLTQVDIAVLGEGEITAVEVLKALNDRKPLKDLPGIVFQDGDKYVQNKPRPVIEDIDSIAFPDYEAFNIMEFLDKQYTNDIFFMYPNDNPRNFSMIMGRSCPYKCNFCFHPMGEKYRQRSLKNFFEELDEIVKKYRINTLSIFDELFSSSKKRIYEFCDLIKPYGIKWFVQMRVDIVDNELLKRMKEAGCYFISYGLESLSEKVLRNMKKKITIKQIENALELTYNNGIGIQGIFIFGDEMEDWDSFYETLNWWKKNRKYQINLDFITAFPGTLLYKNAVKNGRIKSPEKFIKDGCPVINLTQLSDEEFKEMQMIVANETRDNPIKGELLSLYESSPNVLDMKLKCYHCGSINEIKNIYYDSKIKDIKNFKMSCRVCNHKSSYDLTGGSYVIL